MVPGFVLLALLGRERREGVRLEEVLWLSAAVSVAAASWVGLVLAEVGRFGVVPAALILAAASLAGLALRWRGASWPLPRPTRTVAPALLVVAAAVALDARPSEYIVGGRDPGAYVAAMGVIGRTGGIVYTDPAVRSIPPEDVELFYRHPEKPAYSWSRFMGFDLESPATGRVVPQFFHLFPVFGAYLFQAMGIKGALATPPVFAILATVGVYLAFARLFGPGPALLGSLLLCGNVVQVWFARYPVSETMSQFLLFGGLLTLALAEERGRRAFYALAGAFFGLSLLVRIDSVLLVVPLAAYVLIRGLGGSLRRGPALALLLPFGLLAAHAAMHAVIFAPKYLHDVATRRYWNYGWLWLLPGLAAAAALVLARRHRALLRERLRPEAGRLRERVGWLVVALAAYAYFARPVLSAWAGGDGNDPDHQLFARLGESLARALPPAIPQALSYRRLAAHDAQAFYRLGWFVTPLGLALGVAGLVHAIRRWEPRRLMLVLLAVTFGAFYFYKIRVYNDYYFALRRFLPVVWPALMGFAALALGTLWRAGRVRRWAAAAATVVLAAAFALPTHRLGRYVDWKDSVRFVKDVARRFGPRDVVVFEHAQSIHLLSLPLWAAQGVNILELARFDPDPERLRHLVQAWSTQYEAIYFVHTYRTDLCGLFLQRVDDQSFGTFEWERSYVGPPQGPVFQALHFRISRVVPPAELRVPALPELDVGGSDDLQVSGFWGKEGGGDRTYRWSGPCGSLYVPGASGASAVAVTAAVQNRPAASPPPVVRVTLSGVELGSFVAQPGWTEHVLPLPAPLPPGPPVLRFDVPGWRPANTDPGATDTRDLGIMLDRVRFLPSVVD